MRRLPANRPRARFLAAALLAAGLSACALVDRDSFRTSGAGPQAADLARAGAGALPLMRVAMDSPDTAALVAAVQAADQRSPAARFEVVAVVPAAADLGDSGPAAVTAAAADARAIANILLAAGIAQDRVRLGLHSDAGSPAREVRVYLR